MTEIFADTLVWHGDGKTVADPFTWHDVADLIDKTQVPHIRPVAAWEGVTSSGFSRMSVPADGKIVSVSLRGDSLWYFGDHTVEAYDWSRPTLLDRFKQWIGL